MWGVGCILAELYTRSPLCRGCDSADQMSRILRMVGGGLPAGWDNKVAGGRSFVASTGRGDQLTELLSTFKAPSEAITMVRWLLKLVPAQRPTAAALLKSKLFAPLEMDYGEWLQPLSLPSVSLDPALAINCHVTEDTHDAADIRRRLFEETNRDYASTGLEPRLPELVPGAGTE